MTLDPEARKFWADGTPATMDPARLVEEMERTWRECMKYDQRPSVMCIPGGLWLRVDGLVSYCLQVWREPDEADRLLIDQFRTLITAQDFAFPKEAVPKFLPVEPPSAGNPPAWHQYRGSRRR